MKYQWILPQPVDETLQQSLAKQLHIHPIIARILINRQIDTPQKIERFFNPHLEQLYDPFLLEDMDKAVERIIRALRDGEHILIYGDYDVDGVTSVTLLYDALFRLGGKVSFFIPSRFTEGYGVSRAGIEEAKQRNAGLIITVDCGITAVQEIDRAQKMGMDVIVCDHHEPADQLPNAVAVLDPKREDSQYPFKELAGCGVAFKVLQAVERKLQLSHGLAENYLDLVALGTAADIVQLTDENRVFVKIGLERINQNPRPGIQALLQSVGWHNRPVTVSSIVFNLAPRLNAVGRISNAKKAVHLLATDSLNQALNIARILEKENQIRKDIDEETFESAKQIIEEQIDLEEKRVLVLAHEDWHPGVIGIVASRIMERYNRPTVLISIQDGMGKGSARSTGNFDIFQAFQKVQHLLLSYGGHRFAAGITIDPDKVALLDQYLNLWAQDTLQKEDLIPKLQIDAELDFKQLNGQFFNDLKKLAPYGPGNMRPVFLTRDLQVYGQPSIFGHKHLKVKFKQEALALDAVGYNFAQWIDFFKMKDNRFQCSYVLEENTWNGQTTIQMKLKDFEVQ